MINIKEVLERLEKMIGSEFEENEIIIAFDSESEVIIDEVEDQKSNFEGQGLCKCYNVYENIADSEIFTLYVNDNNKIVSVK